MTNYNKQVAQEQYEELRARVEGVPALIEKAPGEGPVINNLCETLGAAISALKSGPPDRATTQEYSAPPIIRKTGRNPATETAPDE